MEQESIQIKYSQVPLKKLPFTRQFTLTGTNVDVKEFARTELDVICNRQRYALETFIWSREVQSISATYVADWWQALKSRFAPAWFIARYPIQYQKITLKAIEVFPKMLDPSQSRLLLMKE